MMLFDFDVVLFLPKNTGFRRTGGLWWYCGWWRGLNMWRCGTINL
jgi:hypothetical protein